MSRQFSSPPSLNRERRFPGNMQAAHALVLKAKQGRKGNRTVERYALPAFNVTNVQGIDSAFTAFETLGSSGLMAFSNSALKHMGGGDPLFGLEVASDYVARKAARSRFSVGGLE